MNLNEFSESIKTRLYEKVKTTLANLVAVKQKSFFAPLNEKVVTSVSFRGTRTRHLQKRPGYIRQGYRYIPQSAKQKLNYRIASRRRIKTINAQGSAFKRRLKFKIKLAWRRRNQQGLVKGR